MLLLTACRHQAINWREVLGELLFLQNYWANLFNHTWSLAVEEHFYLLCAAGAWWLLRRRRPAGQNPFSSVPRLFLLTASFCLVVRLITNHFYPSGRVRIVFFCTHIRMDSLFFGVLLSYYWHFHFTAGRHRFIRRYRWFFVLAGFGLLAPMFFTQPFDPVHPWVRVYGFVLCYLAGGALLFGFLKIFEGARSPAARFLGFLGANSYSTYLWHQVGIGFAASLFAQRTREAGAWVGFCLFSHVFAWIIGVVAARMVEFPVLKLRDRWFPSLTGRPLKG
jgi:peptidoglycan/LPS O-acetylase OafA/YrhL